jgi:hypothetical protein
MALPPTREIDLSGGIGTAAYWELEEGNRCSVPPLVLVVEAVAQSRLGKALPARRSGSSAAEPGRVASRGWRVTNELAVFGARP